MKKFTSILCALVIALGVNAAPQLKKAVKGQELDQMRKEIKATKAMHKAPKALKEEFSIIITSYVATPYPEDGDVYVVMKDEDGNYSFMFDILGEAIEADKTYTLADMNGDYTYGIDYVNYAYIVFQEASFTLKPNGESFLVEATVVDANGDTWKLSYDDSAVPHAPEGGEFVADGISSGSAAGLVQYVLSVKDELLDFYVTLDLEDEARDVESGRVYTEAEMNDTYLTGIKFNGSTIAEFETFTFTKIVEEDKSFTIALAGKDSNGNEWLVSYEQAAPTGEASFTGDAYKFALGCGLWHISGKDADNGYTLHLRSLGEEIAGTYTEKQVDDYWTYVAIGGGVFYTISTDEPAEFVVTVTDGVVAAKGFFVATNDDDKTDTLRVSFDIACAKHVSPAESHQKYDVDEDFSQDFLIPTIDDQYLEDYGVLIVEAEEVFDEFIGDSIFGYKISLEFNVGSAEQIPAGEYCISELGESHSVSYGYLNNYIYGSFVAALTEEGGLRDPVRYLSEGFITVDYTSEGDIILFVDALNSYGKAIRCQLGTWPEAIDNVENAAAATKKLENGRLVIEKNGVRYNALGTIVK